MFNISDSNTYIIMAACVKKNKTHRKLLVASCIKTNRQHLMIENERKRIVEFITANAVYIGLAFGSGLALLWPMLSGGGGAGVPSVSPTEAVFLMNRSKLLILDVRDEAEFASGHIQGAKNVPLKELTSRIKELEKFKTKSVLVHCQRGMRSKMACRVLRSQEFTQVHNLNGGLDKWVEAKMPLVKG